VTKLFQKYDGLGVWDGRTTRLCFGEVAVPRNGRLEPSTRVLVFTPDGKGLLTGVGTQVQRWDLSGGDDLIDRVAATYATGAPVDALACSPDGKHLVAAGRDKMLRLYALAGRDEPLAELQGHQALVPAVTFAGPQTVVSADVDGAWLLWRLGADRKPVAPQELPRWHARSVAVLACSAQEELAATADSEGTVCVGKLGDKTPLWKDRPDGAPVRSLAFAPDGQSVVYATDSGLGRILLKMPPPAISLPPPRPGDPVAAGKP
jgi:WD40 repeat protein